MRQVAGFDRVDGYSGSLREAMSASGFDAGLIIHTKLATTRVDGDRDLWGRLYLLDSLFTPFLFSLLNTVEGMGVSVVEKACFTWRVEEG